MSHLQCAWGCDKDFSACCCQPPELPQRTPGQKWGSEENSTELQTKLSPFMASICRGSIWIRGSKEPDLSTSQIINSCTWGLKLLSAYFTTHWNRSLLYYSQPIFSKETILSSYLLQTCLIWCEEAGVRGLQTLPAKVSGDPEAAKMSTVVRTREYLCGENSQDLRAVFLPSKSKPL